MTEFQNNISRPYYHSGFTGYYRGGPGTQAQRVYFWPVKQMAQLWELGHSSGMPVPRNLKI
jgi:hypothetical protein